MQYVLLPNFSALTSRNATDQLGAPGEDYAAAIAADIEVTAASVAELREIVDAGEVEGAAARVQLKVDTGLRRGGAARIEWHDLFAHASDLEREGRLRITGIWSHLAASDDPEHPANDAQEAAFDDALRLASAAGLEPELRHLANSAATILRPSAHYDMVRCGIATYGLDPAPGVTGSDVTGQGGLRAAMTVRARLSLVKPVASGEGVSYGHTWIADRDTTLGLVPAGYAEGIPRAAGNTASVWVEGARRPIRGRVCMDQFVVDLGGEVPPRGTEVILFGPGDDGEPTAQDWAAALGTINYEIVTRIGGRLARRHVDSEAVGRHAAGPGVGERPGVG